ncbi:peptidylprolyl isomerase [Streptomyces sp. NPDC015346]|uniref:peptidylprolyl isomerase n=1 Tax=Streptomyces sp. NPDC015346 TaxID=3364954 RepID=UPI0036F5A3E3
MRSRGFYLQRQLAQKLHSKLMERPDVQQAVDYLARDYGIDATAGWSWSEAHWAGGVPLVNGEDWTPVAVLDPAPGHVGGDALQVPHSQNIGGICLVCSRGCRYRDQELCIRDERTYMLSTALRAVAGTAIAARLVTWVAMPAPATGLVAEASKPSTTPTPTARPGECLYGDNKEQGAKEVGKPPAKPPYASTVKAVVKTNVGDIKLDLDGKKAPCTVNSFTYLAGKDFFDRTNCHRLTTGALKVLQCGDPTASGSGGPAYKYGEENLPKAASGKETAEYAKGTLAMANAGPGTNGSQFFMVYGDSELPPNYTVFGKATSGMDLLEEVADAGSDDANGEGDGAPKKKVTIQDVTIAQR